MILKNFKTLMKMKFTSDVAHAAYLSSYPNELKTFVKCTGETVILSGVSNTNDIFTILTPKKIMQNEYDSTTADFSNAGLHMLCGFGTVSDVNKYSLEDKICDLKVTSTSFKNNTDAVFYLTSTFKNETENPIIVNEVAVYYFYPHLTNTIMIIHEVLPEPITIMPNTEETLNVTIY